tara:strand:- start:122 stop:247 length:126 start_codon:yes stop_codon:yes gene_type:complete
MYLYRAEASKSTPNLIQQKSKKRLQTDFKFTKKGLNEKSIP